MAMIKISFFHVKIKNKNFTRFYKHGSDHWYKEIEYYEGTKNTKQITEIGKFSIFHDLSGFCVVDNQMTVFVNKRIKKYYPNKKIKSIEIMGGEPNSNKCDVLCGKQYYYNKNGSRDKILNYHYTRETKTNSYNIIKSEGLHGEQKCFYDNGNIFSKEFYFLGVKHGWQYYYCRKGRAFRKEIYYSGKLSNIFEKKN